MTFIERFTVLMNHYGLSAAAFARRIGVTSPSITHILNGRNKYPSTEMLIKISDSFPQVSTAWLLRGEGPMLLNGMPGEASFEKDPGENPNDAAQDVSHFQETENPEETDCLKATQSYPNMVKDIDNSVSENPDEIEKKIPSSSSAGHSRSVTQILVFYDDGTYEMYRQACV